MTRSVCVSRELHLSPLSVEDCTLPKASSKTASRKAARSNANGHAGSNGTPPRNGHAKRNGHNGHNGHKASLFADLLDEHETIELDPELELLESEMDESSR